MAEKEPVKKVEPSVQQAPGIQPGQGSGTPFQKVKLTHPVNERDRDPAGCTVSPTGLTRTNSAGFLVLDQLAVKLGQDPATFGLHFGINLALRQIALYPVHGKTPGAIPVRHDAGRMSTTLYLKPLFKEYPDLAPRTRQRCHLFLDVDANGEECVVLALGTALDKPRTSRGDSSGSKA